jgi:hypothetical protein
LSARATQVRDALVAHGAMFFDALLDELHMLPVELEQALGELVSAGLVNADSFAGLRALLKPAVKRSATYAPRTRRGALIGGMDDAGRWALVQRGAVPDDAPAPVPKRGATATDRDALEHIVDAAAPLWRGVLAAARARGRMAAELARARARAATARGARRDSRRPLRRRHRGRAVRAAGSDPGPA